MYVKLRKTTLCWFLSLLFCFIVSYTCDLILNVLSFDFSGQGIFFIYKNTFTFISCRYNLPLWYWHVNLAEIIPDMSDCSILNLMIFAVVVQDSMHGSNLFLCWIEYQNVVDIPWEERCEGSIHVQESQLLWEMDSIDRAEICLQVSLSYWVEVLPAIMTSSSRISDWARLKWWMLVRG